MYSIYPGMNSPWLFGYSFKINKIRTFPWI